MYVVSSLFYPKIMLQTGQDTSIDRVVANRYTGFFTQEVHADARGVSNLPRTRKRKRDNIIHVDVFSKDWIFVPICCDLHWSLMVIQCNRDVATDSTLPK